ncbi:MAG: branched-chain amino acid ABC transporter permease [Clostridia bacterium]|nr:branched-chain amino acid ABC transporter permease [Clostridia bacterium]
MELNIEFFTTVAELISAVSIVFGVIFACYRWYLKQNKQNEEIRAMKEENTLICYALQACLDGLEQLGANHTVPKAKEKLEKHLNVSAHR